jgi:hypothetical protein
MLSLNRVSRFTPNRFAVALRGLAGLLAAGLLVFELLSTNGRFHQALHPGGKTASNGCVVCLFAKGHVDTPSTLPFITLFVHCPFDLTARSETTFLVGFFYLAFPSRAPPARFSLPLVLG